MGSRLLISSLGKTSPGIEVGKDPHEPGTEVQATDLGPGSGVLLTKGKQRVKREPGFFP